MNCCRHKYFVIYRGDDTDFPGNQELIVEINTTRDLTGCSAHFSFQGFTQDFAEIPSDKKLHLIFPSSETKKFALGASDAKLWLTNGTKIRTVENRIHIVVTNNVNEAYNNDDPQAITVTISGGGGGATVVLDDTVTETSSNGVKSSGIWSWVKSLLPRWLTSDYAEPATAASVAAKANKAAPSAAGNLAALTADGDIEDSGKKPSDFRETTDNTCHKTTSVAGEWSTVTKDGDVWSVYCLDASGQREWVLRCNGRYYPNSSTKDVGDDTATSLTWVRVVDWDKDFDITFTRTFTTLASKDHTFVTADIAARSLECGEGDAKQTVTVQDGVAKLDDFFTGSNSLLTATIDARLPYPLYAVPSTGLLKDRAINTTSLASVTVPDNFTDLLIRALVASSLSVTMPNATTKYGDTFPGEAGEYLITITKTGAAEAYVRTIKLEEVA